MYAAIDDLADKLHRQVIRHKEKLTDHHRNGGALKDQKTD
jgi:putative sigma-54 modulation protein